MSYKFHSLLTLLTTIMVTIEFGEALGTCVRDIDKCSMDECCVQIGRLGLLGRCKKYKKEDEKCEIVPSTNHLKEHVYEVTCPCGKNMKCTAKDEHAGKKLGTCQSNSSKADNSKADNNKDDKSKADSSKTDVGDAVGGEDGGGEA